MSKAELERELAKSKAIIAQMEAKHQPTAVKLPAPVAKEFDLVGWVGGSKQSFGKFGVIDINTITLERAKLLAANGFKKLVKKEQIAVTEEVADEE